MKVLAFPSGSSFSFSRGRARSRVVVAFPRVPALVLSCPCSFPGRGGVPTPRGSFPFAVLLRGSSSCPSLHLLFHWPPPSSVCNLILIAAPCSEIWSPWSLVSLHYPLCVHMTLYSHIARVAIQRWHHRKKTMVHTLFHAPSVL